MAPPVIFCRQVRARSKEHRQTIPLLHSRNLSGQIISILRQELDSLVRVIYLLSITDKQRRAELVQASIDGRRWTAPGSRKPVTDREMVDLAQHLHGWTQSVYRFGCGFIHLSSFHDYKQRDPLAALAPDQKAAILDHMRFYHGGPTGQNPSFQEIIQYLPAVFLKIADNLECYLQQLEDDGDLDD